MIWYGNMFRHPRQEFEFAQIIRCISSLGHLSQMNRSASSSSSFSAKCKLYLVLVQRLLTYVSLLIIGVSGRGKVLASAKTFVWAS